MGYKILAINPGSTSTKVALYEEERPLLELTLSHSLEEIGAFAQALDQLEWRREIILNALAAHGFDIHELSVVIGRGGLVRPIPSGVYEVNERMCEDLRHAKHKHACNLGGLLALEIAQRIGVKAYIADPPVVDEMSEVAHISGLPMCPRKSIFHALNHKATARLHCEKVGIRYEEANLIVVHMGGGISVAAHLHGEVVDVNNALDGDGPFAPDRAGTIQTSSLVNLCFSGQYTQSEVMKLICGKGGLVAHMGTNSVKEIRERAEAGDPVAQRYLEAMCYNIAKQIGSLAPIFEGRVDGIVLTGGIAHGKAVTDYIDRHCSFIAPIYIYPGENELESLARNALGVLTGKFTPKEYK